MSRGCCFFIHSVERLEVRKLLAAVPFGAAEQDTAEFMLGDVLVSVVLFESNGENDPNQEDWTPAEIENVKHNVQTGMQWWVDLLEAQHSVHELNFHFDFDYADQPVSTTYEPVSRPSDDFVLWVDDFFATAGVPATGDFSQRIRHFNHSQRVANETHWAFTIFVVDSSNDVDDQFDRNGTFRQSFAYAGGRFFVTLSSRPASSIAHEAAHMFWAMDEYGGSKPYSSRRGYYNTQNTNASDAHPDPTTRVRSIMDSHIVAYPIDAASNSSLETIGWRDSDRDGIFDVLDVEHELVGSGNFDSSLRRYSFQGTAHVQTLPNQNPSGSGRNMTINTVDAIQVRMDNGAWQTVSTHDGYQVAVDFEVDVPTGVQQIEVRAIDLTSGVASPTVSDQIVTPRWQNPIDIFDVNADLAVTPMDALVIINELNATGPRLLTETTPLARFLDSNGDGWVSSMDALVVINELNKTSERVVPAVSGAPVRFWRSTPSCRLRLATDEVIAALSTTDDARRVDRWWDSERCTIE